MNKLTAWAYTTGKVHLKSDGSAWRPLVHIEDISSAFIAVLKADEDTVRNQAFHIGAPDENYRVREVAGMVRDTVPGSDLRFASGASADTRCYRVSFDKAMSLLKHYKPKWNVKKGIEECYAAYQERGVMLVEFRRAKVQRLAHIKQLQANETIPADLRFKKSICG